MLINLRNALMTGKRLPHDAEVEYLESTGTQWINSGVMSEYPKIHAGLWYDRYRTRYTRFFGNYKDEQHNCIRLILTESANDRAWVSPGTKAGASINVPFAKSEWHNVYLDCTAKSCTIDGELFTTSVVGTRYVDNIFIFADNRGPSANAVIRISFFKIWDENGVLVRDYIPVRVGTVGYLYDRVTGALFGNAGTGDFVLGPDVVPVEYLESTGTQWIDTGIVHDQTFRWECDAAFTSIGLGKRYIGQTYKTATGGGAPRSVFGASGTGYWYAGLGNWNATGLAVADTDRHVFVLDALQKTFQVDDNTYAVNWSSFSLPTYVGCGLGLFGRSYLDTDGEVEPYCLIRIYSSKHYQDGTLVRDFIPVRVGTEGAMMDVLTRRIYRNAGTGAFTYGNDLKYPIPAE